MNRYVRGFDDAGADAIEVLSAFDRWPTWMWGNQEIAQLVEWLRHRNDRQPFDDKVGFYGLDVYSLWESMRAVLDYLKRVDGATAAAARKAFECFEPYQEDVQDYARATIWVPSSCENEVVSMLAALRRDMHAYPHDGREAAFDAEQNALVVREAEHYYRTMARGGASSWNVRDRHMMQTLERLLTFHRSNAKAIVWEHNTHVGDARYTNMAESGEVNVGQLARERYGEEQVVLVGFSSYCGTVIAGTEWDAPMQVMNVPPGRPGSWEDILHQGTIGEYSPDKLLIFDVERTDPDWLGQRGHRAIGVVYHPAYAQYGNYVPTVLPRRYDALLYLDETSALHPLGIRQHASSDLPETYPSTM